MRAGTMLTGLLIAATAACGGSPEPGEMGYPYNVDGEYNITFDADDGQAYSGTISLTTSMGGAVTGTMALTNPLSIDGTGEGLLVGAQLDLEMEFFIPDAQCGGIASSTMTVLEGGVGASGDATMVYEDGCDGPGTAALTFSR